MQSKSYCNYLLLGTLVVSSSQAVLEARSGMSFITNVAVKATLNPYKGQPPAQHRLYMTNKTAITQNKNAQYASAPGTIKTIHEYDGKCPDDGEMSASNEDEINYEKCDIGNELLTIRETKIMEKNTHDTKYTLVNNGTKWFSSKGDYTETLYTLKQNDNLDNVNLPLKTMESKNGIPARAWNYRLYKDDSGNWHSDALAEEVL